MKNESGRLESGGWPGKGSSKCEGSNDTREHAWSIRGGCKAAAAQDRSGEVSKAETPCPEGNKEPWKDFK